MAMRRRGAVQDELWIASSALSRPGGHRFYEKLNELVAEACFDKFVEDLCLPFSWVVRSVVAHRLRQACILLAFRGLFQRN